MLSGNRQHPPALLCSCAWCPAAAAAPTAPSSLQASVKQSLQTSSHLPRGWVRAATQGRVLEMLTALLAVPTAAAATAAVSGAAEEEAVPGAAAAAAPGAAAAILLWQSPSNHSRHRSVP